MNSSKLSKSLSRIMATLMLLTMGFVYCSSFTAFAAVDLDVTIVPPDDSVRNKQEFEVNLQIVTKSANGYVELAINIEYDADILALSAPVNLDGYRVTGSKGQLTLTYFDPSGTNTPTPISNEAMIPIKFIVLESAPDTTTKIKATIDHAYNERGKNITWTPIYDKEIEVIRINDSAETSSSEASGDETSSVFVVGNGAGVVSRTSSVAGNGGKIASVIIGAIVVFAAGMVAGYIICMRKSENHKGTGDKYDDYYEDDYVGDSSIDSSGENNYSASLYPDNNEDGFYKSQREEYEVSGEEDYFSSVPTGSGSSGNYLDAFNADSIINRNIEPVDFGSMVTSADVTGSEDDDDDYPILFMTRDGNSNSLKPSSSKPTFDEKVDSLFGKYSDNVDRNIDDGYGGSFSSSKRRRDNRSERSRRNR